jgi:2-polyprenyl-6-methoxyphenol hydroxylase-like FAD-dependent oxidoreductase
MTNSASTTVLISGASIAGPSLALWLSRYGFRVTVVERAPELRPGGQAVDFKGPIHRTVLERMGIWDEIQRRQTGGRDTTVVDAGGEPLTVIPGSFTGGDVEIRRGDLAELLYERTRDTCEYVFGDSITSLTETADGVQVTFRQGPPRTFDLVVGADGIHSNVRRLAYGPESDYVKHLGHYYALAEVGQLAAEPLRYNEPGRMVTLGGPKAPAFFTFASEPLDYDRWDTARQKQIVADAYRGMGWRTPEVLDRLAGASEFYLDSISQSSVPSYSRGRVVLLGDSAYGNTLGGFGTGLAVVGAYVLAGELMLARGDHRRAFARYQELFTPYAKSAKSVNAGPFLAPPNKFRMWGVNATFNSRLLMKLMMRMTDNFATDIELLDYPALRAARA